MDLLNTINKLLEKDKEDDFMVNYNETILNLVDSALNRPETYFIVEGLDKAGKSTFIKELRQIIEEKAKLKDKNVIVKVIKNPDSDQKREIETLHKLQRHPVTDAILYSTFIDNNMRKAWVEVDSYIGAMGWDLEKTSIIYLIDRWYLSTLAYQKAYITNVEQSYAIEEIVDYKIDNFFKGVYDVFDVNNSVVNLIYLKTDLNTIAIRLQNSDSSEEFYERVYFLKTVAEIYEQELDILKSATESYPMLNVLIINNYKKDSSKHILKEELEFVSELINDWFTENPAMLLHYIKLKEILGDDFDA